MKKLLIATLLFCMLSLPQTSRAASERPAKIAISVWIGWMPFWVMQSEGFIEKRCKELGIPPIEFAVMEYTASLAAYQSGSVDGVVGTIMDTIRPCAIGVPTTCVLINDFSNGGDGLLFKGDMKVESTKKEKITIQLEQFSVSHYLFLRYLDSLGGKYRESDFIIKNLSADNAGKAFLTDPSVKAVVTWNPHLYKALENDKGSLMFSSKEIPGEIIDMLVLNSKYLKKNPKVGQALVNAWYDVMDMLKSPKSRLTALGQMASEAGATVKEFERMMEDVVLFEDPEKCIEFMESSKLKKTEKNVVKFLLNQGQIDDEGSLTFEPKFVQQVLKQAK